MMTLSLRNQDICSPFNCDSFKESKSCWCTNAIICLRRIELKENYGYNIPESDYEVPFPNEMEIIEVPF